MATPGAQAPDLLSTFDEHILSLVENGQAIINHLSHDVTLLDTDEATRSRLAGALLVLHDGRYLAVPHSRSYHRAALRTHAGALETGTTAMSSQELNAQVAVAYLDFLRPPKGGGSSTGRTFHDGTHSFTVRLQCAIIEAFHVLSIPKQ